MLGESAEQGNSKAQHSLGVYCQYNAIQNDTTRLEEINNIRAFKWFEKSALQGNAESQRCLGLCYEDGNGVEDSEKEAFSWYKKSAEQGDGMSQLYLGKCYLEGFWVEKNETLFKYYFLKYIYNSSQKGVFDHEYEYIIGELGEPITEFFGEIQLEPEKSFSSSIARFARSEKAPQLKQELEEQIEKLEKEDLKKLARKFCQYFPIHFLREFDELKDIDFSKIPLALPGNNYLELLPLRLGWEDTKSGFDVNITDDEKKLLKFFDKIEGPTIEVKFLKLVLNYFKQQENIIPANIENYLQTPFVLTSGTFGELKDIAAKSESTFVDGAFPILLLEYIDDAEKNFSAELLHLENQNLRDGLQQMASIINPPEESQELQKSDSKRQTEDGDERAPKRTKPESPSASPSSRVSEKLDPHNTKTP